MTISALGDWRGETLRTVRELILSADDDIVVENDAASVIDGKDPQLERGIAEVLKAMEANPKKLPGRPADPVKTPKH